MILILSYFVFSRNLSRLASGKIRFSCVLVQINLKIKPKCPNLFASSWWDWAGAVAHRKAGHRAGYCSSLGMEPNLAVSMLCTGIMLQIIKNLEAFTNVGMEIEFPKIWSQHTQ